MGEVLTNSTVSPATNIHKITHFKTFAGIICDSGAASISDCQVFVDEGMTNPKSKYHSMDKRIKITISRKE